MKRRSDRNHVIYQITAPQGEKYIGVTVVTKNCNKSLDMRWKRHVYFATVGEGDGLLQQRIRVDGSANFKIEAITVVRGKAQAHQVEKGLIKERLPELNIECTGKKRRRVTIA